MTRFFLIVLNDFLMIASDKLSRKSKTMEKEKEGIDGHNLTQKKKYLENRNKTSSDGEETSGSPHKGGFLEGLDRINLCLCIL